MVAGLFLYCFNVQVNLYLISRDQAIVLGYFAVGNASVT